MRTAKRSGTIVLVILILPRASIFEQLLSCENHCIVISDYLVVLACN